MKNSIIFTFSVLSLWQITVHFSDLPLFILPSPLAIAKALILNWKMLLFHSFITSTEILLGIFLALSFSLPAAIFMFWSRHAEKALTPILIASQAIPVFAIAPLLVIWFGYGMASKVVMASIIIFFPITISLLQGFKSCDREYKDLFSVMGADFWKTFRMLYWPWALPYFFGGLKVAVSVATIGAVIGEWVGAQSGLGYLMVQSNARLKTDVVFASILLLSVIGLILWNFVHFMESRVLRWKNIQSWEE